MESDKYPPFFREANFGFRCVQLLAADAVWDQAGCPVQYRPPPALGDQKPCPDEVFEHYLRLYDYNKSELQPTIETVEDLSVYARREKVSFNAAYGNERVIAYLYIPRTGRPPYQTVIFWPGISVTRIHSVSGYTAYSGLDSGEVHTRNRRAFVWPVLQGTLERIVPPENQGKTTALENGIMWVKDFKRTIDYLETRPDTFDTNKLAFEGLSWGGIWAGVFPAMDSRIKVVVSLAGGLEGSDATPEYSQLNFAPRIKIPVLLQGGQYDSIFPVETSQKPLLKLFGTAGEDKHHRIYDTGHALWTRNKAAKDELDFLDRYLGPVK